MTTAAAIASALLKAGAAFVDHVLAALPPEERPSLERALSRGARLLVECDPTGEQPRISVVVVDAQGSRHELSHVPLRRVDLIPH
jgi:hypothetical protein